MTPNQRSDTPARWRLIEATNGYDVDNGLLQIPAPVPPGPASSRSRSVRPGQTLGRFLSAVSAAQRRRANDRSDMPGRRARTPDPTRPAP